MIQLAPPLICTTTEIDFIVSVIRDVLTEGLSFIS